MISLQPGAFRDWCFEVERENADDTLCCDRCGDWVDELIQVEDRDVLVGYRDFQNICRRCAERLDKI